MRIGLISFHSFSQPGGVKMHVLGLHKEFQKRGIYSKIIVPRRKLSEDYGKDVILLGTSLPISFSGSRSDFDMIFNPISIEEMFKKEKFDILHFHNFGLPLAFQILERSDSLNILTFHANLEGSEFLKTFPFLLYLFEKIIEWKIDGIIGVAPLTLEVFKNYSGPKIVIPNGIDLERFNPRVKKIQKYCNDKINILFLGRIEERKGLIYLLRAYKILEKKLGNSWVKSNLRLIIAGEGPLKEDLEKWTQKNRLKNVIFEGKIKEGDVPSYYNTADIYCSPAIYGESFGIVLIEAMASGVPVVAFANKGYKGVLEKGRGREFLVKPKDYKTLAKKLEILIKNPQLRKEMGEWGIKEAQKYSWPKITDQILSFYEFCKKNKQKREAKSLFL